MDEELEQEFPAFSEEETAETKEDPFTEILEGLEGVDGALTEEQPVDQTEDAILTDGFSETEIQQLQELMEMQQAETSSSVGVDVETFTQTVDDFAVTMSSVILFAAFMICGCMAAIKMIGGKI